MWHALVPVCASMLYFIGVALRFGFILRWNRASDQENLWSDPLAYFVSAQRFCDARYEPNITDTIFPPGGGIFFGLLMKLDPSMEQALRVQFLMACLVPLLLMVIARLLFGARHGWLVLAMASLYFPLWEYHGYFMSEGPFQFFLLLSFFLLLLSLRARWVLAAAGWGLAAGLMLGVASAFKSIALVSGVLTFFALLLVWRKHRIRLAPTASGVLIGLVLVLTPLSMRASRLNEGRFLLIANEAPRSFLLGHHGRVGGASFTDAKRGYSHEFGCPVAAQRGYTEVLRLNVGVYEPAEIYKEGWAWIKRNPGEALLQAIEHSFDLFYGTLPWPGVVRPYVTWVIFFSQVFLMLILFPAVYGLVRRAREILALHPAVCGDLLALAPVASVFLVAFLYVGEPRYRIPYDGLFMLLAVRAMLAPPTPRQALFERLCQPVLPARTCVAQGQDGLKAGEAVRG